MHTHVKLVFVSNTDVFDVFSYLTTTLV